MRALDPLGLEAKVLPFRRPAAAVRVRRRNRWLPLVALFGKAATLVGVPLALALWLFTSPTFALARVEVEGERVVEPAWIEATLAPLVGENLLRLSLPAVERLVRASPWVAEVRLEKRLPDGLLVELRERRPGALLRTAEGLVVLDEHGAPIAPWQPGTGGGELLLVSVGGAFSVDLGGALAIAEELGRVAPAWARTLSEVEVLADDEFRLDLGALPFPLLVRAGTLAERVPTLAALLPELERRYPAVAAVDLRFERRIVFQPILERS
ncbi:MAG: FtsQ-type POTRA domain-containing protein [Thermoanaerobaculia bacterium]|nr:FtsQ-type POTRA domain-containing protein [Thermoanaerobaculia bacterium]